MKSAEGQALAQWISAGLSFAAIAIALWVFLAEQRRDNRAKAVDRKREADAIAKANDDEKRRRNLAVSVCLQFVQQAIETIEKEQTRVPPAGLVYVAWNLQSGGPAEARPLLIAGQALQIATQHDARLARALANAIFALTRLSDPVGVMPNHVAADLLKQALELLAQTEKNIGALLEPEI